MKSAIISGSNGLIGSAVSNYFQENGIKTIRLGRKLMPPNEKKNDTYIQIEMRNISNLKNLLKKFNIKIGSECVFFNFAWSGDAKLTDGIKQTYEWFSDNKDKIKL